MKQTSHQLPEPLWLFGTTKWRDYIVIYGGENKSLNKVAPLYLIHLETKDIESVTLDPPLPNRWQTVLFTYNDKVYSFGGSDGTQRYNDLFEIDLDNSRYRSLETKGLNHPPCYGHTGLMNDSKFYVIGGKSSEEQFSNSLWILNMKTLSWTKHDLNEHVFGSGNEATIFNNRIYVTSYVDKKSMLIILDLKTLSIRKIDCNPMVNFSKRHGVTRVGSKMIIYGCTLKSAPKSHGIWIFDCVLEQWIPPQDIPMSYPVYSSNKIEGSKLLSIGSKLYIAGGYSSAGVIDDILEIETYIDTCYSTFLEDVASMSVVLDE
eukprot:gb/GECH01014097.1/.p1 GENE.gb/GECH01014097.1/~~gb/GECH01014097.1/.p1  ORF type:complete len:318 (+),score=70.99 gb/GECH01014097.1/:1-954(+)